MSKRKDKFNPYKILNIERTATSDEISKAYKKLAIKYHPDKNKEENAHDMFVNIKKAYEILSDDKRKSKYDKFGVCEDNDLQEMHEEMMRETILKSQLKQTIKINIDIVEIIKGVKKTLNLTRDIIKNQRLVGKEPITVDLDINLFTPINKPIIVSDMGKQLDDIYGDLVIYLKIVYSNNFKINKNNLNLIYTHKISLAQSLCGLEILIPYYNIKLYYDDIIKNNYIYKLNNHGLTIEENNINKQTDIEIHFDISYNSITKEQINQIKKILNHDIDINQDCLKLSSYINNNTEEDDNCFEISNISDNDDIFSGFGGFPGFGGMPGMNNFHFSSNFGNARTQVQECQTQ
jgi:DnaJ-class molecular chaperone